MVAQKFLKRMVLVACIATPAFFWGFAGSSQDKIVEVDYNAELDLTFYRVYLDENDYKMAIATTSKSRPDVDSECENYGFGCGEISARERVVYFKKSEYWNAQAVANTH